MLKQTNPRREHMQGGIVYKKDLGIYLGLAQFVSFNREFLVRDTRNAWPHPWPFWAQGSRALRSGVFPGFGGLCTGEVRGPTELVGGGLARHPIVGAVLWAKCRQFVFSCHESCVAPGWVCAMVSPVGSSVVTAAPGAPCEKSCEFALPPSLPPCGLMEWIPFRFGGGDFDGDIMNASADAFVLSGDANSAAVVNSHLLCNAYAYKFVADNEYAVNIRRLNLRVRLLMLTSSFDQDSEESCYEQNIVQG
eukprot:901852-Amphidinium_carterae.1